VRVFGGFVFPVDALERHESMDTKWAKALPKGAMKYHGSLLQRRVDLLSEYDELLAEADEGLTPDERRRADRLELEISNVETEIAGSERARDVRRDSAREQFGATDREEGGRLDGSMRPSTGSRYAQMWGSRSSYDDNGFESFSEFASAMFLEGGHPRLMAAIVETGDSAGYLVPTEYSAMLLDMALEDEIVRPRAQIFPMKSNTRTISGFRHSDASGSQTFGGFTGGWTAENTAITESRPQAEAMVLNARKLAALTEISNEAIADSPDLGAQFQDLVPEAMGWFLDKDLINGDGVGKPLGVINAGNPALIAVAKESGQAADTVTYTNLTKIFARVHPRSRERAVWVINSDAIPELLSLTVVVSSGGSHIPVLTESNGEFRILTRPVIFTEKVPALGDQGDVGLYDFSQYAVGLRQELVIERSPHLGFNEDTTWIRAKLRGDGFSLWDAPYTPLNGATLSPFVTLAERA